MQFLTTNPPNFCASYSEPDLSKQRHVNRHNPLVHFFNHLPKFCGLEKEGKWSVPKMPGHLSKPDKVSSDSQSHQLGVIKATGQHTRTATTFSCCCSSGEILKCRKIAKRPLRNNRDKFLLNFLERDKPYILVK
jgi:hypothetical protein